MHTLLAAFPLALVLRACWATVAVTAVFVLGWYALIALSVRLARSLRIDENEDDHKN